MNNRQTILLNELGDLGDDAAVSCDPLNVDMARDEERRAMGLKRRLNCCLDSI